MNKENYFIVNIKFADLELENETLVNLNPQCVVLLNGNIDDKLSFDQNVTLFVHNQDTIGLEIKIFDNDKSIIIGNTEIKAVQIIQKNVKQFSEWHSIKTNNENKYGQMKILIQYNLQSLGFKNNSFESPKNNSIDINQSNQSIPLEMSFTQRESPFKKINTSKEKINVSKESKETDELLLSTQKYIQNQNQNEYDYIEESIINQDMQLKKLMNKKNQHYIFELRKDLDSVSHLYRDLLQNPCNYCEKQQIPKIKNKINNLQNQILQLQEQSDEIKLNKLMKCECDKNRKVDVLIKNYKNNQDVILPVKENNEHITQLQIENEQLRDELNKQKQQLEDHLKEKEEIEKINKKQKFRIFVLEADLKTFFRKTEIQKAKPEFRTSFKLKEFRAIYDLFVDLKEERNELAQLMNGINDLENKKFQFKKDQELYDQEENSYEFKQFEILMKQKNEQMNRIINDQKII